MKARVLLQSLFFLIALTAGPWARGQSYCTPSFTNLNSYNCGISALTMGSLYNSTGTNYQQPYTDFSASMFVSYTAGATVNYSVLAGPSNSTNVAVYIDWNNDYNFSASEKMDESGQFNSNSTYNGSFDVPITQTPGVYRMRVAGDIGFISPPGPCSMTYSGDVEDYSFVVLNNSLDVMAIDANKTLNIGNNTISLTFANVTQGTTVNTVDIGYSLNNGTPVTQSLSSLGLTQGGIQSVNFSQLLNISTPGIYTLKVWVRNPNGQGGGINTNDTITRVIQACYPLNGTYTIDPNGSGGSNFTTFEDAVSQLITCGVNGPVDFQIASGTYAEQISIPEISGASSTNTIRFVGAGRSSTTLTYANQDNDKRHTLQFNGASYISFENMTIRSTNGSFGWTVHLTGSGGVHDIKLRKLDILCDGGGTSTTNNNFIGVAFSASSSNNTSNVLAYNNLVDSCLITGGYCGISFYGVTSNNSNYGNYFTNNTIQDAYYYGIYTGYLHEMKIMGNVITPRTTGNTTTNSQGIYSANSSNSYPLLHEISGNRIYNCGTYGIYLTSSSGSVGSRGVIKNNMIGGDFRSTSNNYGIYMNYSYWWNVYNNSINMNSNPSGDNVGFYTTNNSNQFNLDVRNNMIQVTGTSGNLLALFASDATVFSNLDYNNYVVKNGPNLINIGQSLSAANFKGAYSFNSNSFSIESPFQSSTNLRYSNGCVTGIQLAEVTKDIDGDTRTSTPNVGADEFINASTNDIGILSIVSPSTQVSPGAQDVVVRLKNFGTNTITSAQISYMHNGGTPVTISWSGVLLPCGEVDITFTGSNQVTIVAGINNIHAYTTLPNGAADNFPGNDGTETQVCPAMSGNFTIDQNGSGGSNFKSFKAAVDALSCSGLNGPVYFSVAAGNYNEQIEIRNIQGSSSVNTITFDGGDGNAASRVLTFSNAQNTNRHTLLLDNVKYLTLRNISVLGQSPNYGWVIHLFGNGNENISIENCRVGLSGSPASSTSSNFIPIVACNNSTSQYNNATFKNITVDSCEILRGYFGIFFYGNNNSNNTDIFVTNNYFDQPYYYGYYHYYTNAVKVENNVVRMRPGNTNSYGFYMTSTYATGSSFTSFANNIITNAGRYGIYLSSVDNNSSSKKGEIVNNMIGGGFTHSSSVGLYMSSCDAWNIYHNSINIDYRITSSTSAAWYASSCTQLDARNNVFALTNPSQNSGSVFPVYMNGSSGLVCDYNNYYKPGSTSNFIRINGSNYNASNFIGGGGFNNNSYFRYPEFISSMDLHSNNGCLIGTQLASVTKDIDGDNRPSNPSLGADEGYSLDANVSAIIAPSGTTVTGTQDVIYRVKNGGKTTITSFTAYYSINGGAPVSQNWTGTMDPCDSVTITFTGGQAAAIPNSGVVTLAAYIGGVNGGNDDNQLNDSTSNAYCNGPMSGVYTVIPGNAANRNFPDLATVMNVLNSCGMSGDVELQIGTGVFQNQVLLDPNQISGLASYRLSFIGVDSASSIITYNSGGYTVRLNGADNVTFRNLGIHNTGTSSAFAVHLTNGADNNLFEHCHISAPSVSNTSVIAFGIMGPSYTNTGQIWGQNNTLQDSRIEGGYRTVHIYGSGNSSLLAPSNRVLRNYIVDGYNYSVYFYFQSSPELVDNYITAPSTASAVSYYSYCESIKVERNFIYGANQYGLYLTQCNPSTSYPTGVVTNNMIGGQSNTGTPYGIYTINTYNMNFFHNSIYMNGNGNTSRAFYQSNGSGNQLVNNIFVSDAPNGHAMYLNSNNAFNTVDYNILYSASANLAYTWGTTFYDMASLQASNANFNVNSLSQFPNFINVAGVEPNLHLTSDVAAPQGDNTLGVNVDIDNDSRCPVSKTIGADESEYIDAVTIRFTMSDTVFVNAPFTAINADIPGSLRSYEWDFGNDGSIDATTFNATYAFNTTGVKEVKLKSSSCNGADSLILTVVVINPTAIPQADFISDKYTLAPFETMKLQDLSTNGPTAWTWSITPNPNGLVFYDPYAQNPEVFFGEPGVYDVCLTAENGLGTSAQKCKSLYITVRDVNNMCIGNLSSEAATGEIYDSGGPDGPYGNNENCFFLIEPCASSVTLKFSEFNLANSGHFLKVYDGVDQNGTLLGTFSSSSGLPGGTNGLTANSGSMYLSWTTSATGSAGGFAATWTSVPKSGNTLTAGFDLPDSAFVLETVDFTNTSTGSGLTYSWDVDGDGNEDAQSRDVQYIFSFDGTYYPRLTISDACGNSQSIVDTIVVVTPTTAPVADFTADARVVNVGDTVKLKDLSTNGAISWNYTFSPGNASIVGGTSRDPFVTFSAVGTYDVTLDADNAAGTGSVTKTAYINVVNYCEPDVSTLVPDIGINRVSLTTMANNSASGVRAFTSYFGDPSITPAQLDAGGTYDLQVSRNTTLNAMNRKVWIDYNGDGDFDDANELVGHETAANTATWTLNFTVPVSALRGATRMRVGTAFADSTNEPCGTNFFGEVEEYRVVINDDITPPVITRIGGSPQYIDLGQTYTDSGATATDAVDGNLTSAIVVTNNVNINVSGTYYVYYNVTDAAGNAAAEVSREVIVRPDLTPPILQLASPTVITIPLLGTFAEPGYSAQDAISGNVTGSVQVDRSAFDSTKVGTYAIVYVASDAFGNTDTAYRIVNVIDDIAPVITLNGTDPMNIEVFNTFNDPGVTVSDNYDAVVNASVSSNVDENVVGTYTITYEAKDSSGNISFLTRTVNVHDTTAPVLMVANTDTIVVEVFGNIVLPDNSATDNYDTDPQVNITGTYDLDVLGEYTITLVAEDAEGNQSAGVDIVIQVVDTEAPVITLNGSYLTTIMRWSTFNDPGVTITDNYYTGLTATTGGNFVTTSEEGLYYITYDVTDPSGNVAMQVTRAINVVENTTGVEEVNGLNISMYPNPANSSVEISLSNASVALDDVVIVNSLGQQVMLHKVAAGARKTTIDLQSLTPGVYYVKVSSAGKTAVKKLVISR